MITQIVCIDPHQTAFVGNGSDHLQLIKLWPSRPQEGCLWRGEIFGSALLQPVRSVCISSERFFLFLIFQSDNSIMYPAYYVKVP